MWQSLHMTSSLLSVQEIKIRPAHPKANQCLLFDVVCFCSMLFDVVWSFFDVICSLFDVVFFSLYRSKPYSNDLM